jgi:ATP-dependent RNA helicase HelY
VVEKLSKFTGERHELLTPGEYTQFTGRAGRRGIDDLGYAIVLWSPWVTFEQVAGLASRRAFAITSAFRPTYNMAVNLVRRYPPETAHHLLNLSFAQYQADRDVVRIERRLEQADARRAAAKEALVCDRGDAVAFLRLQRRLADLRASRPSASRRTEEALSRVRPGDVLRLPGGRAGGPVVVLSATRRRDAVQLRALTAGRRRLTLRGGDFAEAPEVMGRIELPEPYAPTSASFQREAAARLSRARLGRGRAHVRAADDDPEVAALEAEVAAHPVSACADLPRHRRAWGQVERIERERASLERQVKGRSASLARQFDRLLALLSSRGYLDGWRLTAAGRRLSAIYHETDLLVAECLHHGLFDGLDAPSLAGLASVFTYEARGPGDGPAPWFPSGDLRRRWSEVERLHGELVTAEAEAGLPTTRPLDPGFVALARSWAAGEGLDEVLEDEDLSGGDFVRNVKQLIDLLQQLGEVAPTPTTASAARGAADGLFRGVVQASSHVAVTGVR